MSQINPLANDFDLDQYLCQVLREHIKQAKRGRNLFHLPKPEPIPIDKGWDHFHLSPEMFIQIGGSSTFKFPSQTCHLQAGEILIVPRQLAHQETMHDGDETFCNLVVIAVEQRLSYHITIRDPQNKKRTRIITFERMRTSRAPAVEACMDEIIQAQQDDYAFNKDATKSFTLGLLTLLLNILEQKKHEDEELNEKVVQCMDYIDYHIGNSMLSVNVLANWLGCHPDYLSKLFHQEKGERLNNYINEQRIALAKRTLHGTNLSVGQIAQSSGFQDPAYFSRLFKKRVGCTPVQYRKSSVPP